MKALYVAAHAALFPAPGQSRADTAALAEYENPRNLRRMAHFCRLGLLTARRCLAAAEQATPAPEGGRTDLGLVIATGYGPVRATFDYTDSILEFGEQLASPTAFSTSVHNIAASSISLHLGLAGPAHTVSQGESSLIAALDVASGWLASGRVRNVLLGALDEYDPDLAGMLAAGDIPRPLPCDGALFLLLTTDGPRSGPSLTAWDMGSGLPAPYPEGKPGRISTLMEGHENGPRHPAGPVHTLAASLDRVSRERRPVLCVLEGADGLYSSIRLDPGQSEQP